MIDINSPDFPTKFDLAIATVGQIGHGYVGKAVEAFFKDHCRVLVYDKYLPNLGTLEDVVRESELIFISVPTPMKSDGACHTGILESVFEDVYQMAKKLGRDLNSFIVIHKCTVPAGFTLEMQEKYFDMRIMYSPEFLTEKNSIQDFKTSNRMIFGGELDDAKVVTRYIEAVYPQRVREDRLVLLQCDSMTAEMVKLFTNGILMTKVLFCNEIYQMCQKLGVEYREVQELANLDRRIGYSHTTVPGPDGSLGAGGHCFPKDINNLRSMCREMGIPEKMFTAVIERNDELREKKDWLDMKGRAVIDD
jgi:UDPglucose 6-dehydrogenase